MWNQWISSLAGIDPCPMSASEGCALRDVLELLEAVSWIRMPRRLARLLDLVENRGSTRHGEMLGLVDGRADGVVIGVDCGAVRIDDALQSGLGECITHGATRG